MAISNEELLRSINLMTKALTDFQYQSKLNGTNLVDSLERTHRMLARAAIETGFSPESLNKLLLKFVKSNSAVGDQAKLTQVLTEFNKRIPDYERLANIMSAEEFNKFVNRALEKIKNTPIKLNTKENISFLSKAIARANREYATTGFGRIASDFYRNATTAQLRELKLMRQSIESGNKIGDNKGGMLSGLLAGTAAQMGDIIMENAGFGQLPGKMMGVIDAFNKLREARKLDKDQAANERNAALLANSRKTEAAYGEQKRVVTESKDILVDVGMQRDELTGSLLDAFKDVLSKTDLSEKLKQKYERDLMAGTLTENQLKKITASWKRALGDDITPEDKKEMTQFRSNIMADIASLNEMNKSIEEATQIYNEEAKRELDALVTATKARADVDNMIFTELEGQFARIDKELKGSTFKNLSAEEITALREQLQADVTKSVSKKYGINVSESKGMYNDHTERVNQNLSELGIEMSDELKAALEYNKQFAEKLAGLSRIFQNTEREPRIRIPEIRSASISTRVTPRPISSTRNTVYTEPDLLSFEGVPALSGSGLAIPSDRVATPQPNRSSEAEIQNRQDALETIRTSERRSDDTFKLLEKVFGQNADKPIKVQVTNWPAPTVSQNLGSNESPSVPLIS